jgi:tRNA threonylcarbamoyladenosine biosynthesis protein TsaE
MNRQHIISTSATDTFEFGKKLGSLLQSGDLVALIGNLGTGKTVCIQGIAVGLGVHDRNVVTSPTYTLIHEYQGRVPVYHFDVYRLAKADDLYELGYEEYFYGNGVTVIEWADRIPSFLPDEYLALQLRLQPDLTRSIRLQAYGEHYQQLVRSLTIEGDRDF